MKNAVFIPLEILSQQELPLYVKLVYGRIACMLGKNDRVVMTTDEIAMQCGITRRNAAKALPELARLELVRRHESLDGRGLLRIFELLYGADCVLSAHRLDNLRRIRPTHIYRQR